MTEVNDAPGGARADIAQPPAAPDAAALADARAEARAAERERIGAIVRSDEAEGRIETALTLALDTDMTPDQASKVLTSVPKSGGAAAPGIAARASREDEIGADPVPMTPPQKSSDDWQAAVARANRRFAT